METAYVALATRPEKRVGSDEFWDKAEGMLLEAARLAGVEPVIAEGDGAFYAPKLDFIVKDAIGRERDLRHLAARLCPARAAGRRICRRGRHAPAAG